MRENLGGRGTSRRVPRGIVASEDVVRGVAVWASVVAVVADVSEVTLGICPWLRVLCSADIGCTGPGAPSFAVSAASHILKKRYSIFTQSWVLWSSVVYSSSGTLMQ